MATPRREDLERIADLLKAIPEVSCVHIGDEVQACLRDEEFVIRARPLRFRS